MENIKLKVMTEIGKIEAGKLSDPDFPGIYIDIDDKSAVVVEYNSVKKCHRILVWNKDEEDYKFSFDF